MDNGKYVDLHMHTNRSDGSDFVEDCILKAAELGLKAIAITDHNCFDAVEDAICMGEEYGIEVIPAIEIDADYLYPFHFLAYFSHKGFLGLQSYFDTLKHTSTSALADKFISCLKKNGYKTDISSKNKKHIKIYDVLCALCKNGYFKTPYEAERELILSTRRIFDEDAFTLQEIIDKVHNAGGIIVWAHPFGYPIGLSREDVTEEAKQLKEIGIDGIEAIHFSAGVENTKFLIELAKENELIVTGGSDYHGRYRKGIELGFAGSLKIPYSVYQIVKNKLSE